MNGIMYGMINICHCLKDLVFSSCGLCARFNFCIICVILSQGLTLILRLDNPSAHRLVRWCCSCSLTLLAGRIVSAGASDTQSFIALSGSMRCVDGRELWPERRVPATIMDAAIFGAKKGWTDAEDNSAIMGVSLSLSSYHSISEASFEAAIVTNSKAQVGYSRSGWVGLNGPVYSEWSSNMEIAILRVGGGKL